MQKDQKGFIPIFIVIMIVAIIGGLVVLLIKNNSSNKTPINTTQATSSPTPTASPTINPSSTMKLSTPTHMAKSSVISSPTKDSSIPTPTSNNTNNPSSNNPQSNQTATPIPTSTPVPSTPTPTPTPTPTQAPTVSTNQGITISESCSGSTLNVSVYGDIPSPSDYNNGLWSTLTDNKSGQTMIYEYDGNQGPPIIHISANFPQTGAIRGSSVAVVGDGRVYTINVYTAPFTYGTPSLSNPVASNAFNMTCK